MFIEMHRLIYAVLDHHKLMVVRQRKVEERRADLTVLDRFGVYREVTILVDFDDDGELCAELIDY